MEKVKGKVKVRPKKISAREVCRDDGVVFKNAEAAATELGVRTNTIIKAISDENICRKVKGLEFCYLDDFGFSKPKEKSPTWGVHVNGKEFIARFRFEGQKVYLGRFKTKEQAIKARDTYLQNAKSAKEKSEINPI